MIKNIVVISDTRKEYQKEWAKKNPDKVLAKAKRYREKNRELCRQRVAKYQEKNRELCIQRVAKYREEHLEELKIKDNERVKENWKDPEWREKIREKKRLAYQNNPEHRAKRLEANRRWRNSPKGKHYHRAYESDYPRTDRYRISYEDWINILDNQSNKCVICQIEFSEIIKPQRDHIYPFILGGRLTKENTQALCKSCNSRKGAEVL